MLDAGVSELESKYLLHLEISRIFYIDSLRPPECVTPIKLLLNNATRGV